MDRESAYLPIADYGLISDCRSAALVSRDGSIDWCCGRRFDSAAVFDRLLDHERGGYCAIVPTARGRPSFRSYADGALVVETVFRTSGGQARVLDCFTEPFEA